MRTTRLCIRTRICTRKGPNLRKDQFLPFSPLAHKRCAWRAQQAQEAAAAATAQPQTTRHGRVFEDPPTDPAPCGARRNEGTHHFRRCGRKVARGRNRAGSCGTSRQRISRHSPTTPRQLLGRSRRESGDQASGAMMTHQYH